MTKELLEQYPDICGERKFLMDEIAEADKVNSIAAFSLRLKNANRIAELSAKKNSVEAFLDALPWGKRRLVRAVLKCGTRWDVVRRELHSFKSPDALRMEYSRIFQCPKADEKI